MPQLPGNAEKRLRTTEKLLHDAQRQFEDAQRQYEDAQRQLDDGRSHQPGRSTLIPDPGRKAPQAEDVQQQLAFAQASLQMISTDLDASIVKSTQDTIDKLKGAMNRAYDIAVFIQGDYDQLNIDEPKKNDVLHQAVVAFQRAEDTADQGLRTIGDYHAQVMEIQNTRIGPLRGEIDLLIQQNQIESSSLTSEIATSEEAVRNLQQSLQTQTDAVNSLQSKVADEQTLSMLSDFGFTMLTIGIGNLINDGPLDPFGTHQDLDDARGRWNRAQQDLTQATERLNQLQQQGMHLSERLVAAKILEARLPVIQSEYSTVNSRSQMLQSQFGFLKDTSSKLLIKVKTLEGDSEVAEKTVYMKKEFGDALLQICSDVLIDSSLIDEVQKVRSDLITHWGGPVPDEVYQASEEVAGKISLLSPVPSIKERLSDTTLAS